MTRSGAMPVPRNWPAALVAVLRERCGDVAGVHRLAGRSGDSVWRIDLAHGTRVVKVSRERREFAFYRHVAGKLAARRLAVPVVEWSGLHGGLAWIAIEWLPHPLPRERWLADGDVLAYLVRLHRAEWRHVPGTPRFRPRWTPTMNAAALRALGRLGADCPRSLEALRVRAGALFAPVAFISGDPNPRNWGVRDGGAVVLFDWARFGRGAPALDLGISVPGLAAPDTYMRVAQRYREAGGGIRGSLDACARMIALAKAWSVVEFLAAVDAGKVAAEDLEPLFRAFGAWTRDIDRFTR